jgi:hypothetical protein
MHSPHSYKIIYSDDVSHITSWLLSNHTPQDLTDLITDYLLSRDELLMTSFINHTSPYYDLAEVQDRLGFDNLIGGRIPRLLVNHMTPIIKGLNRLGSTPSLYGLVNSPIRTPILFTHNICK